MTTSGVEQSFSKQCLLFGPHRVMSASTERDESVLTLDRLKNPEVRSAVLRGAQRVWLQCRYGMPRAFSKPRVDKGVHRMQAHGKLDSGEVGRPVPGGVSHLLAQYSLIRK